MNQIGKSETYFIISSFSNMKAGGLIVSDLLFKRSN